MRVRYIAEIGNNHNGDINLAKEMIDAAIDTGVNYVKFQIYNIDKFLHRDSIYYKDFVAESLSFEDFRELQGYTEAKGCQFFATPFDEDSLSLLNEIGLNMVKIASGDMNNEQLLLQAIKMSKQLIVSVGGATLDEIDAMVRFLNDHNARFSILHCIINYPARFEELNLGFIDTLKKRYSCPVGFSDHSPGIEASLAAIALGATIIEKHFTTNRALSGGDNEMSVLPEEFRRLVREGNNIALAIGDGNRKLSEDEQKVKDLIRRVFFAKHAVPKGTQFTDENLLLLRPNIAGEGFDASFFSSLQKCRAACDLEEGQLITREMIDGMA